MDLAVEFNFTLDEKAIYEEFKQRMLEQFGNEAKDDYKLYRFLKARDFNIEQAKLMFQKHVDWRKTMKLQPILEDYQMCEVQKKYVSFNILCYDKMRYPVGYTDSGHTDIKGALNSEKGFTFIKGFTRILTACETVMKEESEKLGHPVEKWNLIVNVENLPVAQVMNKSVIQFLLNTFSAYEANYPERLKTAIIINATPVFYYLYNLLRPILAKRTANKIKFFGKDKWKAELLNLIDAEQLPTFLGGEKSEPEGKPSQFEAIRLNGSVPKKYYFRSPERRLCGKPRVKEYFLKRMEKMEIFLEIDEPGSSIEWEFETETGEIAFGLFRRKNDVENEDEEEFEPIIPIRKVNAGAQIEKDNFICDRDGVYVFVLDNTFSWLRDKQVFCKAYVKKFSERKTTDSILERIRNIWEKGS